MRGRQDQAAALRCVEVSGARALRWLQRPGIRNAAGILVLGAGLLTLAAPWLMRAPALHGVLQALGCRSLPGF